jgi:hypothetical protein
VIVTNYRPEDLKKLPLRAIVALAARCARRVEHLALLPDDDPETERCRATVSNAICLAEDFARGLPCSSPESTVRQIEAWRTVVHADFVRESATGAAVLAAHAAAAALRALDLRGETEGSQSAGASKPDPLPHLADVTADLAAEGAFMAAMEAIAAEGHTDAFVKAAVDDYQSLLRLDLGSYPHAGKTIDPSPRGPLGPREFIVAVNP